MRQRGLSRRPVERGILQPVELKRKEQQLGRDRRHLLLRIAIELGALRVGRVAGIDKAGIGHDLADEIIQRLIACDAGMQRGGRIQAG